MIFRFPVRVSLKIARQSPVTSILLCPAYFPLSAWFRRDLPEQICNLLRNCFGASYKLAPARGENWRK